VTLGPVEIGEHTVVGSRALVLPNVRIGSRAVVGANSVVLSGTVIPDGETWAGNPAVKVELNARARQAGERSIAPAPFRSDMGPTASPVARPVRRVGS
jgi:acetyltransferase-like isoleucine patch superfamily enzyme